MGGKKANVVVNQDKLSWLRETLEWQKDMQDPQVFLNTLKTELFEDEVYVFTPKGKIQVSPFFNFVTIGIILLFILQPVIWFPISS